MRIITTFILSLMITPLWADNYEANQKRWDNFVQSNKWGGSQDFWLEKNTAYGWEKVALVFGYYDDYEGCEDIILSLKSKYPSARYRCIPANRD